MLNKTANKKQRVKKNKFNIPFLVLFIVIVLLLQIQTSLEPFDKSQGEVRVQIPAGSSTRQIAAILHSEDLIENEYIFLAYAKLAGYDKKLKAGNYVLSKSLSLSQLLEQLSKGQADVVAFTVPEGYSVEQIAELLAQKGLVNKDEFLDLAKHGDFNNLYVNNELNVEYNLEGYLFPDTYHVSPDSSAEEIINLMLKRFAEIYDEEAQARAKNIGLKDQELITLASMIEKEAKLDSDRSLIAGVIYNRLKKGMRLQIDATIQYIYKQPKARLTYKDLEIESPYNTYLHEGLPPGPIASPGKAAIEAALYPAETDFLYYVAKSDGSHVFSKTLKEHNEAKKKYLN